MDVLFQANLTQTLQPNYLSRNILTVFVSYSHAYKLLCFISYVLYKSALMSSSLRDCYIRLDSNPSKSRDIECLGSNSKLLQRMLHRPLHRHFTDTLPLVD